MKLPFSYDADTGIQKTFHYDESVDARNFILETTQNVDSIIEANKRDYNSTAALGQSGKENFRLMARIPLTTLMDLRKKGITKDPVAFKRWLNDPDNRHFRTASGNV